MVQKEQNTKNKLKLNEDSQLPKCIKWLCLAQPERLPCILNLWPWTQTNAPTSVHRCSPRATHPKWFYRPKMVACLRVLLSRTVSPETEGTIERNVRKHLDINLPFSCSSLSCHSRLLRCIDHSDRDCCASVPYDSLAVAGNSSSLAVESQCRTVPLAVAVVARCQDFVALDRQRRLRFADRWSPNRTAVTDETYSWLAPPSAVRFRIFLVPASSVPDRRLAIGKCLLCFCSWLVLLWLSRSVRTCHRCDSAFLPVGSSADCWAFALSPWRCGRVSVAAEAFCLRCRILARRKNEIVD